MQQIKLQGKSYQSAQPKKIARGLNFQILKLKALYCLVTEHREADQTAKAQTCQYEYLLNTKFQGTS